MSTELKTALSELKLHYLSQNIDDFIARVTKGHLSPISIIEEICRLERDEAKRRTTDSRLRSSRVNARKWKTMNDFDWAWPKKIDRPLIERLFTLNFIEEPANVFLIGPSSVGKTTIARNLVHEAVLKGKTAIFVEAHDLMHELEAIDSARILHSRLKFYAKPQLLVIDEVGFLSFSTRAGDLLFQLVSQRYEKNSTMITTNVPFKDWNTIFPTASCVSAMLERLLHRNEVVTIEGDSYRMKEADERKVKPKPSRNRNREVETPA